MSNCTLSRRLSPALLLTLAACSSAAIPAPEAVPTRIILTWAGDPAHTQAVTWRTEKILESPQAQIAVTAPEPGFEKAARTVNGKGSVDDLGGGRSAGHYAVYFEGLEPATSYTYRVGDGQTWSEWSAFRTASTTAEPFRFIYLGDAQNSIKSLWSRTVRAAYAATPDARFLVHAGDLLAEGYDDNLWGEWTGALSFISATVPSIPAPGNHDVHRAPGSPDQKQVLSVSPLWRSHFASPANGPGIEEMRGQSYFIDYQGARIVALDVNVFANADFDPANKRRVWDAQLAWLEKTLANNPNRWTIVVQHQPLYAVAKGRDYSEMRAALGPLYDKYGVDLVLQGHDHAYARTHKVAGGGIVDPAARGAIYAITVSGPKMYQLHEMNRELMARVVENRQCYQIVNVSSGRLEFNAYTVDGAIADSFELRKTDAGSTYINRAPTGYQLKQTLRIDGEGGWDYLAVDDAARRLYVSHGNRVEVLDADSGEKKGVIEDTPGVHGIALAPELHRGFISSGKADRVAIFDTATLEPLGTVATGKNPDAILYDAATRRVFVSNGGSQSLTVFDAATGKVAGAIPVGGRPEFLVSDGSGHVFVNIEDHGTMLKIDARTLAVTATWPLAPCEEPSSLAIDAGTKRLFAGCRNHLMAVVGADDGKVIATVPIGDHVDATVFDASTGMVLNSNGDGTISVVRETAPGQYAAAETIKTKQGAKTMALDPKTKRLFLPTADYATPAAGGRRTVVPGSFQVLVLDR